MATTHTHSIEIALCKCGGQAQLKSNLHYWDESNASMLDYVVACPVCGRSTFIHWKAAQAIMAWNEGKTYLNVGERSA